MSFAHSHLIASSLGWPRTLERLLYQVCLESHNWPFSQLIRFLLKAHSPYECRVGYAYLLYGSFKSLQDFCALSLLMHASFNYWRNGLNGQFSKRTFIIQPFKVSDPLFSVYLYGLRQLNLYLLHCCSGDVVADFRFVVMFH